MELSCSKVQKVPVSMPETGFEGEKYISNELPLQETFINHNGQH